MTTINEPTNTLNDPVRPGYSNMVLILDDSYNVVGREKDHLHARTLALTLGYTLIEECQPERKRWRYARGIWARVD